MWQQFFENLQTDFEGYIDYICTHELTNLKSANFNSTIQQKNFYTSHECGLPCCGVGA